MSLRKPLLLLTLPFILAACGSDEPIRIGVLTGVDDAGRRGAQLAAEQVNLIGGLQGRRIEITITATAPDAGSARIRAEELVAAKVAAIIAPADDATIAAALPVATAAGIPVVATAAVATGLSGKDDHFLRTTPDAAAMALHVANHQATKNGVRQVVALVDNRYGMDDAGLLDEFAKAITAKGGALTARIPFSGGKAAHAALVTEAMGHGADALLIVADAADTAGFARAARQQPKPPRLIGSERAATRALIEFGGADVEGIEISSTFDPADASPENMAFQKAYTAGFGVAPDPSEMAAYDATRATMQAFSRGRSSKAPREALLDHGPYAGVQQGIIFDRHGDTRRKLYVTTVREGRFVRAD
jgi:branched-chain amino acid transport system substrate-binding protein